MADLYWQDEKDTPEANLHMLDNEILCDIAFLVGYGGKGSWQTKELSFPQLVYQKLVKEGVKSHKSKNAAPMKILAHRYVLVTRSSVFERMFVTDMTESKKGLDDPIAVVDIDSDTFREMLRYIYGNAAKISNDNVFCLWYSARKYMLQGLEKLCVEHLLHNLSHSTLLATLEHCLFFECDLLNLRQYCIRFISLELLNISDTEYIKLSHDALNEIVSQDTIRATEKILYIICQKWADPQVRKLGYLMTVMCKTCGVEYAVPFSDLAKLCDEAKLKKDTQMEVNNEMKRKHDDSINEPVVNKLQRGEDKASPCHANSGITSNGNCVVINPTNSNGITELSSTCPADLSRVQEAEGSSAQNFSENVVHPISDSQVSIQQESNGLSASGSGNGRQDAGDEGSGISSGANALPNGDHETNSAARNSSGDNEINAADHDSYSANNEINLTAQTSTSSINGTDSVAQTTCSLSSRLFPCDHVDERNPLDSLLVLRLKTDLSQMAVLRQVLGDIIYRIRFSTMPQKEFAQVFGRTLLLKDEEKSAIYYDMIMRENGQHYIPRDNSATFDRVPRTRPTEKIVCRFTRTLVDDGDDTDDELSNRYVGTSSLSFKVTKPILLEALGFYSGATSECEPFRVELSIKLGDIIVATRDSSIKPSPNRKKIYRVDLVPQCYILDNQWYEIDFTCHQSRGARYYGKGGMEKFSFVGDVENKPEFQFKHNHGNTTVEQGQLATLSFSYI